MVDKCLILVFFERSQRPPDTNQIAKHIVDLAVGEKEESGAVGPASDILNLGRKGGIARAAGLSAEQNQEIAHAAARWRSDR